jgi:hypothetical protein
MTLRALTVFRGTWTTRLILLASGLIAVAIAATILFAPDAFYAGYGIRVTGNPTLANELKAPAGALLAAGLLMFAGVFRSEYAAVSLTTAVVVYLSYGLSRVTSIVIDGLPHGGMVDAAVVELVIGAVCLLTLLRVRCINEQRGVRGRQRHELAD